MSNIIAIIIGTIITSIGLFVIIPTAIKMLKEDLYRDIEIHNKIRSSSDASDKELSIRAVSWLSLLILLIEVSSLPLCVIVSFLLSPLNETSGAALSVILYAISLIINGSLKRDAYIKGKWLRKYSWKRIYFFVPIIGGFFLAKMK